MMRRLVEHGARHPWLTLALFAGLSAAGYGALRDTPVDAFPDVSENQVIVYATWPGRSPQDVEDQLTYPLSSQLASVAGVRDLRSMSAFGFAQLYVIFHDGVDPYWARSRVLEKLASATAQVPADAVVDIGPDATALGQVFWYVLDGPGQDLATLRALQDYTVRYALQSVEGVAEVASVGGFVREYQVDVSPYRLQSAGVSLGQVIAAVRESSLDVGARTVEQSGAELALRGVGFVTREADLEQLVVAERGGVPVFVEDVATVRLGAAFRRGALADEVGERVGGVVTLRYGANPREVIGRVQQELERVQAALPAGVRVVPFYDRTELIDETMATLGEALAIELVVTLVVVLAFLLHVRSSLVVAATLPIAVLLAFLAMRLWGLGADIMSLSGIAIAIGSMVDMAIISTESAYASLAEHPGARGEERIRRVTEGIYEVAPALATAMTTTVLSFLPVFLLTGQSGKLFRPLAWTKTFAMVAAVVLAVALVPALSRLLLRDPARPRHAWLAALPPLALALLGGYAGLRVGESGWAGDVRPLWPALVGFAITGALGLWAAQERLRPPDANPVSRGVVRAYRYVLGAALARPARTLLLPAGVAVAGLLVWLGAPGLLRPLHAAGDALGYDTARLRPVAALEEAFPGLGSAFMPPLDEGSYLAMPSLLPYASLNEALRVMRSMNRAIAEVPEVAQVVGKVGRAETALDPAPVGMIETIVNLKPRDQWRLGVDERDILADLERVSRTPGTAPSWLQPIETRIVMLQSGIRASLAVRLAGAPRRPDGRPYVGAEAHAALERAARRIEQVVRTVPGARDVSTMRQGGKLYLDVELDRAALARYGLTVEAVQRVLETAVGGRPLASAVEGRERPRIRVTYARELRDAPEALEALLIPTPRGAPIPLATVARLRIDAGPSSIRTEGGQLVSYVLFNANDGDEAGLMQRTLAAIDRWRADARGAAGPSAAALEEDPIPAGVLVGPAGRYLAKLEADQRLLLILPLVLLLNAFLLYFQFRRWDLTLTVFSAIPVALGGGMLMVWLAPELYDLLHFLGLRQRGSVGPVEMTTAVWVGFIALFGIAVDDGVVLGTYIRQRLDAAPPTTRAEVHQLLLDAGSRRIRPMLMTTSTTVLALLPILQSTGRGSDLMQPMALPILGGMLVAFASVLVVPTVYAAVLTRGLRAD